MKVLNIDKIDKFAYKKYGWNYDVAGIGISNNVVSEALKAESNVYLYLPGDPALYQISPDKIIKLVKIYNSIIDEGNGVRTAVIPTSALIIVLGLSNEVKLTESPPPRTLMNDEKSRTIADCQKKIEKMKMEAIYKRNQMKLT